MIKTGPPVRPDLMIKNCIELKKKTAVTASVTVTLPLLFEQFKIKTELNPDLYSRESLQLLHQSRTRLPTFPLCSTKIPVSPIFWSVSIVRKPYYKVESLYQLSSLTTSKFANAQSINHIGLRYSLVVLPLFKYIKRKKDKF